MQIQAFVPVVQRRILTIEDSLLPLYGPLFAIETHMSMEERIQLASCALNLPEGFRACEIGSYLGASTCFIATAATLKNGAVHCVDVWDNRAMGIEPPMETFEVFLQNTARYADRISVHRGEASLMAPQVPDGLDMLFIDGDHSYASVKDDLERYVPKLRPGGVLLLHDFTYPEVQQATKEFLEKRPLMDSWQTHSLKCFVVSGQTDT